MSLRPFHLAFPVNDLEAAKAFYRDLLGCSIGRESDRWVDFDFFGHQITAHLSDEPTAVPKAPVDREQVPVRHFGMILEWDDWHALRDRLLERQADFLIQPQIRWPEKISEQATMFVTDPSGNALEFKSFRDDSRIFAAS